MSRIRPRVLIADDNIDAAETLATLLRLDGHEVMVAQDGRGAIEHTRRARPEIIFLDLGMPGMDGFEAARRLRELPEGAQAMIVALTGWGQAADRVRTLDAGFDAHLVKPVDHGQISGVLALNRKACGP
jgi:CheY-like chemotaxis protein